VSGSVIRIPPSYVYETALDCRRVDGVSLVPVKREIVGYLVDVCRNCLRHKTTMQLFESALFLQRQSGWTIIAELVEEITFTGNVGNSIS